MRFRNRLNKIQSAYPQYKWRILWDGSAKALTHSLLRHYTLVVASRYGYSFVYCLEKMSRSSRSSLDRPKWLTQSLIELIKADDRSMPGFHKMSLKDL